jgi:hypothetical protein
MTSPRFWRRRTWLALFLNGILLSFGCSPSSLTMFLAGITDDKMPPEKGIIESKKKEVTVAVMASFSHLEDRPEVLPADAEMAELVAQHMRLRCQANKEKLKLIPVAQVRSFQNKVGERNGVSAVDVGKHFKTDYVVFLDINALSLYEKKSYGQLYRGTTDIEISLYDMHKEEGEYKTFTKLYRCEYPGTGPQDAGSFSQVQFRSLFLTKVAREVSKIFIAYPSDERTEME